MDVPFPLLVIDPLRPAKLGDPTALKAAGTPLRAGLIAVEGVVLLPWARTLWLGTASKIEAAACRLAFVPEPEPPAPTLLEVVPALFFFVDSVLEAVFAGDFLTETFFWADPLGGLSSALL